jgi:enolase
MEFIGIIAKKIKDTRQDDTIEIILKTNIGVFSASSPNGKSKGKYEAKSYKNLIDDDIKKINKFDFSNIKVNKFDDLKKVEKIFSEKIGANSIIALEYSILKYLAKKEKKEIWQLINPKASKVPMPLGNCIGGGAHARGKKTDFQEFLFSSKTSFKEAVKINKEARELCRKEISLKDSMFKGEMNDENGWRTQLSNEEVIEIVLKVKKILEDRYKAKVYCGIDIAASEFYDKGKYIYFNSKKILDKKSQIEFMTKLSQEFYYIEDCFEENDFASFGQVLKKTKNLVVGDDLTVTNISRLKKAKGKINGIIIKPNQSGSLIFVKEIVKFCKKNKIKMIFSHRSGETSESILADLAFGFGADFIKTGVCGKGREEKLDRLVKIERDLKR